MKTWILFFTSIVINAVMCYWTYKTAYTVIGVSSFQFTQKCVQSLRDDTAELHDKSCKIYIENYENYCEVIKEIEKRFDVIKEILTGVLDRQSSEIIKSNHNPL